MLLQKIQFSVLLGIILLVPTTIAAMPFVVLTQDRFVESRAEIGETFEEQAAVSPDLLAFDQSVESRLDIGFSTGIGHSAQSSAITMTGFLANGSVFTSGIAGGLGLARSEADLVFEILQPSSYSLTGEVIGESDATSQVQLLDKSGGILESFSSFMFGNGGPGGTFDTSGFLAPGEYRIRTLSFSCSDEQGICGQDFGSGSFAASLVIVPEPSTAILIAMGLAILSSRLYQPARSAARF